MSACLKASTPACPARFVFEDATTIQRRRAVLAPSTGFSVTAALPGAAGRRRRFAGRAWDRSTDSRTSCRIFLIRNEDGLQS